MRKTKWTSLFMLLLLPWYSQSDNGHPRKDHKPEKPLIGKTLPDWKEGFLDIHAINTGRGESTLLILPDGTTLLIDAAGSLISPSHAIPPTPQKPNSGITPGQVITNYVKHFIKPASNRLNYVMLSHFDPDHMGTYMSDLPQHSSGDFRMVGVTEVGANIAFDKIIDRGYPDYSFPTDMKTDERIENYIHFIRWAKTAYGATAEQFAAGKNNQIVLKQNPSKYPGFEIRNICSNGLVWTGKGTKSINKLPSAAEITAAKAAENIFSIGLVLSYGKFNYFTAGDLQHNGRSDHPWKDMEAPVAAVVPPVEVMKANHHGTSNCNSDAILKSLSPQTVVIQPWRDVHPNPETVSRMLTVNPDCQLFSTNMTEANKPRLGNNLSRFKSMQGHIVVRVSPGGQEYYVYVLDDNNEEYKVTGVFGPYKSK